MPSSAVHTFTDPDDYAAAIRQGTVKLTVTGRGRLTAKLVRIDLGRLWMQRCSENLPRISHTTGWSPRAGTGGVKAAAITVTTLFFSVSYASIAGLIGWPSEARLPGHFQLDWATVVEPDKLNGSPGSIYLWLETLDENNVPAGTPRAFRVPYSRELAERIGHAKERIEQGMDQAGTARELGVPDGPPDQDQRLAGDAAASAERAGQRRGPDRLHPAHAGDPIRRPAAPGAAAQTTAVGGALVPASFGAQIVETWTLPWPQIRVPHSGPGRALGVPIAAYAQRAWLSRIPDVATQMIFGGSPGLNVSAPG
jgi:hypothetical protein